MDYRKEIMEMLKQIGDEKVLNYLYIVVSDILKELNKE